MTNQSVIIPAFEPNQALYDLVKELTSLLGSSRALDKVPVILIVNDGSTKPIAIEIFAKINRDFPQCLRLDLPKNGGKGAALKTGIDHILTNYPDIDWMVTADADGQHLPVNIIKILDTGVQDSSRAVLGVRAFASDVPLRSWIGNRLTRKLFSWVHGTKIHDTQTGLRGFNRELARKLLAIKTGGYAFELDGLMMFVKEGEVEQVPITTVYEPGNPTSHFNPIWDSIKIYMVLLRHIIATGLAMGMEVTLFALFSAMGLGVAPALTTARILAGTALFFAARHYVFKASGNLPYQAATYLALVGINLLFAIWIIQFLEDSMGLHRITALFIAYSVMFIANFLTQRFLIFPIR